MPRDTTRRAFLKGLGITGSALAVGPGVVSAQPSDDRFIVESTGVGREDFGPAMEVVHDLSEEIGYFVVGGPAGQLPPQADYARDLIIELDVPKERADATDEPAFYPLQWDKQEQSVPDVHEIATGDGARVGIIDDGVLGADDNDRYAHPDLEANVNEELSAAFVPRPQDGGDFFGPGPLSDDHGTHVAGTAAATSGANVVGHAPDAEIVSLRVFSGRTAAFGDILAAHVYAAPPVEEGGADCDVLNLSLGTPPLLPVENPDAIDDETLAKLNPIVPIDEDDLAVLVNAIAAGGQFALDNGTLPVSSTGNSLTNLDEAPLDFQSTPVVLPASVQQFMCVSATGPIGFGWDPEGTLDETEVSGPVASLGPTEPAFYTNYGPETTDVSAPGGNADLRAIGLDVRWFLDLVLSSTIDFPPGDIPDGTKLGTYPPSLGWKAGTSMAAPQVTGLVALLVELDPGADPGEIRAHIRDTASQQPVGVDREDGTVTTAPDLAFEGPLGSADFLPRLAEQAPDSETYRGAGHIDTRAALEAWAND